MANNSTETEAQRIPFSIFVNSPKIQRLIERSISDPAARRRFVSSIISAVSVNPQLAECEPFSIISAALLGESLGLSPSPQLGQYYMVPYDQKEKYDKYGNLIQQKCKKAQFQIGWRGIVQLALRTNEYRKIIATDVRQGELIGWNPFEEEYDFNPAVFAVRDSLPITGYFIKFELQSGFTKSMYWSHEKMVAHADRYSPAFSAKAFERLLNGEIPDKDMWRYSSFWYKDFDDMAKKTLVRQLLPKWGPISIEYQTAMTFDEKVITASESGMFTAEHPAFESQEDPAPALPEAQPAIEFPMERAAADPVPVSAHNVAPDAEVIDINDV